MSKIGYSLRIALYQPDIAGNTGAILRLGACLGIGVDIIEPAGFDLSDRALKRAGMDYIDMASFARHVDWSAFETKRKAESRRIVLATTQASKPYTQFDFRLSDVLLFGRESAGVPHAIHEIAEARIVIPMQPGARSLNLALAAAMIAGEAIRQIVPMVTPPSAISAS